MDITDTTGLRSVSVSMETVNTKVITNESNSFSFKILSNLSRIFLELSFRIFEVYVFSTLWHAREHEIASRLGKGKERVD